MDAAARTATDLIKRSPLASRLARKALRQWETVRLAQRIGAGNTNDWVITRERQYLPPTSFGGAAETINAMDYTRRMFAFERDGREVVAAAAFELGAGPDNGCLLTELALARTSGELHPLAYAGAIFLLERLHDVAAGLRGPTELWIGRCTGASEADLSKLGFERAADDLRRRPDTAAPGHQFRRIVGAASRMAWDRGRER